MMNKESVKTGSTSKIEKNLQVNGKKEQVMNILL